MHDGAPQLSNAGFSRPVADALDRFVVRYLDAYPHLEEPFDPDWRSPCERDEPYVNVRGERCVAWRPRVLDPPADHFQGLERALEVPIHPDVKTFYGRYWSGGLEAEADEGHVSLLLLWNPDDAERLIENLIGHALAQRRARAPLSIFFACTEADSELFLSVDNATGQVLLEAPGRRPLRTVAARLADFIDGLRPASPTLHPERS